MQQQSSRLEMESMREELDSARSIAGELEKRNASLMRMTQQSLGREGDLKQAVNSTKVRQRDGKRWRGGGLGAGSKMVATCTGAAGEWHGGLE